MLIKPLLNYFLSKQLYTFAPLKAKSMEINFKTFTPELLFSMISGKLSAAISRRLYRVFRQEGIEVTPEQWTVMYYLWSRDGVTQQELCNLTFKDKPSMTRLIDNLEKLGCVNRVPSKNDRRINIIMLTQKGRDLESVTKPVVLGVIREALSNLPSQDIDVACHVLTSIFNNLRASLEAN